MPIPSVQGRIHSVSRVKGILCFYYLKLSLIKILSRVNKLQFTGTKMEPAFEACSTHTDHQQ
jgi:hypothetical protein